MSSTSRFVVALLLSSVAIPAAQAATFVFEAPLTGAQESPPTPSLGTGFARVIFDDDDSRMRVQASFGGLTGTTTAAHIHILNPPPATTGGVATQLPSFPGFPLGVMSGSFDQTYDLSLTSSYSGGFLSANGGLAANAQASLLAALLAGNAYFNVHSNVFPGGEIRGDLQGVPEPATWALMIGGFGLIGGMLRRRKEAAAVA